MLTITPEIGSFLARVAHSRAGGASWEQAATEVGFVGDDLRGICADAGKSYDRLLSKARRDAVYEGLSEALVTLRQHMRKEEGREERATADSLARIGMTWYRHRSRPKVVIKPDPRTEGLSDEVIAHARAYLSWTPEQWDKVAQEMSDLPTICPKTGKVLQFGTPKPVGELLYWEKPGYDGSDGCAVGGLIGKGRLIPDYKKMCRDAGFSFDENTPGYPPDPPSDQSDDDDGNGGSGVPRQPKPPEKPSGGGVANAPSPGTSRGDVPTS